MAEVICERTNCNYFSNEGIPDWAGDCGKCMKYLVRINAQGCDDFKLKPEEGEKSD